MSGPTVYFSLPDRELFQFPPSHYPRPLAPPIRERTFRSPFGIAPWLFNLAMRPYVPFAFAAIYILTVLGLNAWNRQHGNKPWWIARQKFFKAFVVVHNVALAIYSFVTFLAMFRALAHTWPGFDNPAGLAGIADSMCKIHGPRGLGDAVTYNTTINIWESKNELIRTAYSGNPESSDVGRLWNEGLAFWGWIFYLSKFYEVVDTFIIVAKGKRSPTLQTYHHAGAMLCMWAGIRYMSPPIWMFVFVNSFIHSLMYTYFTCTTLEIKVSRSVKRVLTTLQITQFVVGASFAALHLFVQYDIPIATPYKVVAAAASAASTASSAVSSATSTVSSVIETPSAIVSRDIGALVKKYLLRAAGEEGVAERIGIPHDSSKPIQQAIEEKIEELGERAGPIYETRWRTDYTKVNCLDTSGEAFAVWLNIVYLFPLTVLFARFFYKAYVSRSLKPRTASQIGKAVVEDSRTAEDETEKVVEDAGKRAEDQVRRSGSQAKAEVDKLHQQLKEDVKKMKEGTFRGDRRVSERVQSFEKQVKSTAEKAKEAVTSGTPKGKKLGEQGGSPVKGMPKGRESPVKEQQKKQEEQRPEEKSGSPSESKKEQQQPAEKSESPSESKKEQQQPAEKSEPKPEIKSESPSESKKEQQQPPENSESKPDATSEPPSESKRESASEPASDSKPDSEPAPSTTDPPAAESEKVPAEDEPANKQDENIADSQSLRPGTDTDVEASAPSTPTSKKNKKKKGKANPAGSPASKPQTDDDDETKPGAVNSGMGLLDSPGGKDSDAMGASGVDVTASTASVKDDDKEASMS